MITTIMAIGKILRSQLGADGIKHHRYVRRVPFPNKGQELPCFRVHVAEDMTFDLSTREKINSESDRFSLFYLNYKSSDADSMKKYLFGDICRYRVKKPKEGFYTDAEVNFTLGDPNSNAKGFQRNSFERGRQDAEDLNNPRINAFRSCLTEQMDHLLAFFEAEPSAYLNFRFGNEERYWYELEDEFAAINTKLLAQFVDEVPGQGYVLAKSLYKTLAAGKICAPQFMDEGAYKTWVFPTLEDVNNLLYAIDFSQKAMLRKGDIKIVVLPRSDDNTGILRLTAQDIETFFEARGTKKITAQEDKLSDERVPESDTLIVDDEDENADGTTGYELTEPFLRTQDLVNITQFDFIFSRASSSPSTPDVDLVELSGLRKSRIGELHRQIQNIRRLLDEERVKRLLKKPLSLRVLNSLNNVLGEVGREKRKYSSHLLKVLPQIYCGTYIKDDLLLPAFIETVERKIRDGEAYYDYLRFDLLFLLRLQDENRKEMEMLRRIQDSQSYRIGQLLGRMARPLRSEINSFEKNYVGLLSRRVAQRDDVITFQNFLDQKLILHERAYPDLKAASRELALLLNTLSATGNSTETYDRELCVFGFFESYFEPFAKKGSEAGVQEEEEMTAETHATSEAQDE
jgi:hypothetical protein